MAIFKKTEDQEMHEPVSAAPRPTVPRVEPTPPPRPRSASVIGPTMEFKGDLTADEDLVIEGLIIGTITHHNKHLTVGEKGRVKADVQANGVIVLGQLVGDIHCTGLVSLSKTADVTGNIYCGRIIMEDGATFKGNVEMGEREPAAAAPTRPVAVDSQPPQRPRRPVQQPANSG